MKIYVASSWRNQVQPDVVFALRKAGHQVYDFRHPEPGNDGFAWRAIAPNWEAWSPAEFRTALEHPVAAAGFKLDMDALEDCDACVLVLPCGRSAHLELGWAAGARKKTIVLLAGAEPELMYKMCDHLCLTLDEVLQVLAPPRPVRCATITCDAPPTHQVFWPGQPSAMCAPCARRAQGVGSAMGFGVVVEPLR